MSNGDTTTAHPANTCDILACPGERHAHSGYCDRHCNESSVCWAQRNGHDQVARRVRDNIVTAQDITPGARTADGSVVERVVLQPSTGTVTIAWTSGRTAAYSARHPFRLSPRHWPSNSSLGT